MTDIMKLADNCANACADVREFLGANAGMDEADGTWIASQQARAALQSAIEALQEENALLEGTLESRGRNIAEMQAENERLKAEKDGLEHVKNAFADQMQALQAKLDAMGKGEPVAWRFVDDKDNGHVSYSTTPPTDAQVAYLKIWKRPAWQPLYEAPKALEPLTDDELWKFWWSRPEVPEGEDESMEAQFVAAARSILAAHGIGGTP